MKTLISVIVVLVFTMPAFAWDTWDSNGKGSRPYKDSWGNNYKYQQNLYKDTDRDGVINLYDYNDRNPRIQNPYQRDYDPWGSSRRNNDPWGSRTKKKGYWE